MSAEVAVVIPTHNRANLALRAARVALAQRDVAIELVVVDDGSDDCTTALLNEELRGQLRVIRHSAARGVSGARNAGLAASTAPWVAFLDDDDVWAPDKLTRQLVCAESADARWAYAGMVTVDPRLRILHGVRPDPPSVLAWDLPVRNRVPSGPSNFMLRRHVLESVGGFDERLSYDADWDLWLRVLQVAGPPALADAPLLARVDHGGNMPIETHLAEVAVIERRYAVLRDGRPLDWGHAWRWVASAHLARGRRAAALLAYGRALVHDPAGSGQRVLQAALSSRVSRRSAYRFAPDPEWAADAERWLSPLRAQLA